MMTLFRIFIVVVHALFGWVGLAVFYNFFKHLSPGWFRFWHAVLVVFFFALVYLAYYKFFGYFSIWFVLLLSLATVLVLDAIAFYVLKYDMLFLNAWDFLLSYLLAAVTIYVVHHFFPK